MTKFADQPELQIGGAVPLDKVYVARRTDAELLNALRAGEYCNIVCPRQMGKTSAIVRVRAELIEKSFRTAVVDIAGRLGTPREANDWFIGLLRELNRQLQLGCDVQAWWAASSEPTVNQKLFSFFCDKIIASHGERFVVFLDEIDHSLNLEYADDFFLAIRSLYNERAHCPDFGRLAFCLSGVFTPNELVKQTRTTTYNVGRTFEFQDFNLEQDDLSPFSKVLAVDASLGTALLRAILEWTSGQPFLTASACQKVAAERIDSTSAVDRLMERVFVSRDKSFEDKDDAIHFETIERFIKQRSENRLETADLYRHIIRGERPIDVPTRTIVALKLSGLVKADKSGHLTIRNRIYSQRFDEQWAAAVVLLGERAFEKDRGLPLDFINQLPGPQLRRDHALQTGTGPSFIAKASAIGAKLFISHSKADDNFVRKLREGFREQSHESWIDSREVRGGDPRWVEIQRAIEAASAYAIVVSNSALQSKWVGKELLHALKLQQERGKQKFPVITLSLDDTKLGVLEDFFPEEPIYIAVSSDAAGVETTISALLVAIGARLAADIAKTPQPKADPLEELVLELTDLRFLKQDGVKSASARARLVYEPATPGRPDVHSAKSWRFVAPIGPIEADDLRWYLEQYAIWPAGIAVIQDRARKVEADLLTWGQLLHNAAMPVEHVANVKGAWATIGDNARRRFSVHVDTALEDGTPEDQVNEAKEVATRLLALPWELLHDGKDYLFQHARPTRVRRRLPSTEYRAVPVVAPPIRILLVSARPEDEACGYIDHRASALPLVEAMEALPGLVQLQILSLPTLPALSQELDRARHAGKPYHVVHFDGHGVYDSKIGLGALCFEHPDDIGKLDRRRHETVYTRDLVPLLRDHRIPLVFLEACQTAQAEQVSESVASELLKGGVAASESVASELLKVGVSSVVAMSHPVLVETARRFVEAFYRALADGRRIGDAMLAGQRVLKDDTRRGRVFGADELRLEDWFVPVLFQEKDDPQLFTQRPARQTVEDFQTALAARLGDLPQPPETGFIGRSRELLALQRLLRSERYAVLSGQGGEGKTALAVEFARWLVRSQQVRRAAFVGVEGLEKNIAESVLDKLGDQLVKRGFLTQADCGGNIERGAQAVERVLREQPTLLVIDNMESILLQPLVAEATPDALTEEMREELQALLALCERLLKAGETRLIFTSREALPAPFNAARHRRQLHRLDQDDAVKLVERVLNAESEFSPQRARGQGEGANSTKEAIEQLVDAVHGHARTLALLAPLLRSQGVAKTRESLAELMAEMERNFPGSREKSLFASLELSLRRLSQENQERSRVLGVFHGGVDLDVLAMMMGWDKADVATLAAELVETGLAKPNRHNHLTLNPSLCPYLRGRLDNAEREVLTKRWVEAMRAYAHFLDRQRSQNVELAATLTVLELANLFALLDLVQQTGDPEVTIDLATSLFILLQTLGKPRLLARVGQVRDAAAASMGDAWNHTRFEAAQTRIEQQIEGGALREAFDGAQALLQRAQAAGEQAYTAADYDLAMACCLLARVLRTAGGAEKALPLLGESRQRFEAVAKERGNKAAEGMASVCLTEQGSCLLLLGRLDDAAAAYEEAVRRSEKRGADRDVAVGKAQLGTVRLQQRRYPEALAAFNEARERFTALDEPGSVAAIWHQIGVVYQEANQPEAAEDAYRKSLSIEVRLGNIHGQARTLGQLGNIYDDVLNRPEEAVAFYRQAADKYVEIRDIANEGLTRNNLASTLRKLSRLDEAQQEIHRAIECKAQFGHASEPWKTWDILAYIETDAGNPAAATDAKHKAIASYLAYRRDGGENHFDDGRIALAVTQSLCDGNSAEAADDLADIAANPEWQAGLPFIRALQAIVAGSRDRILAYAPDLDYTMAAEILLLIETLERPEK